MQAEKRNGRTDNWDGDECLWAVVVAVVGVGCLVCSFTVIQRRRRPCRGFQCRRG